LSADSGVMALQTVLETSKEAALFEINAET
jgi:hypothetical protein